MVDYFPVLDRAVAALDPDTREARRAVYDRARRALVDGLRASDPMLSDTDLRAQSGALETAIRRVEAEALRRAAQPPQASQAQPRQPPAQEAPAHQAYEPPPPEAGSQDRRPLKEERKPLRIVAAAAGVAALLVVGVAAYSFWPGRSAITPPSQRGVAGKRAEPEAAAAYVYLRQPVYFRSNHPVGTIVVDKQQSFLYVVRPSLSALRYGIGVGPDCATSVGLYQIVRKEEWPGWKAPAGRPASDDERSKNPLGARALYLSRDLSRDYRIHGTNTPATIGRPAPLGCFRLTNDDVVHLYDRSPVDTRVVVLN